MKSSILYHQIKKVMLIFPPETNLHLYDKQCCVPMGIAYLGAVLRNDYEVRLLDAAAEGFHLERYLTPWAFQFGLDTDMIMERIREFSPDVVGVSCLYSNQFFAVIEIVKKIKKWNPEVITIIGGTHPTFLPERCLQEEALDYIVMGEAEESLPALLLAIKEGRGHEQIDGLAYRTNDRIIIHPKKSWIKDLDSLPFPARDLLPMEKYFDINMPMNYHSKSKLSTSFVSSRGCPFHCSFCSSSKYWGGLHRTRSPENVLKELEYLKNSYGIRDIKFIDDNLTLNNKRAKAIFRGMIESKFNINWSMPGGVMIKTLEDDELLQLMKKSGCYEVFLAFESGDQWVLENIIHKNLNLEAARKVVRNVKKAGIVANAFFIVGLPGEKLSNIKNTFKYMHSLNLDKVHIFFFNPQPGAPVYNECLKRGLINDDKKTERNDYGLSIISDQDWTAELLEKLVWKEYKRLTLRLLLRRPIKYANHILWKIKNPHRLKTLYKVSLKYINDLLN